jgi:cysteine desulfurase
MKNKRVYLDNNATTKVDEEVVKYMDRFHLRDYAIASSQFSHTPGITSKEALEKARGIIARKIHARLEEIVFTSGATESNNLALKGAAFAAKNSGRNKIIVSRIEDFSVLHTAKALEKFGFKTAHVNVDGEGFVDIKHLRSLLDDKTLVVSIMYANHEVGTIQDIRTISEIVHEHGAYLHTDAAVAFLQVPIDVVREGIDLMSMTAHKIYGPKGVGALFVKKGIPIEKIMDGGFQESNLRAGTENVPAIAGFGKAVEIFSDEDLSGVRELRNYLYQGLESRIDGVLLNGASDFERRIPNNLNVSFEHVEGESVILHLDMRGIAVITGSACFSRALQASHVLMAMGFSHERAHGSIRFSLSKYLRKEDIDSTVRNVEEVVEKLRELSPLSKGQKGVRR